MADNIQGFTMHSFLHLAWKTASGAVVNTTDQEAWSTLISRRSLLKFVIIDEVEAITEFMFSLPIAGINLILK